MRKHNNHFPGSALDKRTSCAAFAAAAFGLAFGLDGELGVFGGFIVIGCGVPAHTKQGNRGLTEREREREREGESQHQGEGQEAN